MTESLESPEQRDYKSEISAIKNANELQALVRGLAYDPPSQQIFMAFIHAGDRFIELCGHDASPYLDYIAGHVNGFPKGMRSLDAETFTLALDIIDSDSLNVPWWFKLVAHLDLSTDGLGLETVEDVDFSLGGNKLDKFPGLNSISFHRNVLAELIRLMGDTPLHDLDDRVNYSWLGFTDRWGPLANTSIDQVGDFCEKELWLLNKYTFSAMRKLLLMPTYTISEIDEEEVTSAFSEAYYNTLAEAGFIENLDSLNIYLYPSAMGFASVDKLLSRLGQDCKINVFVENTIEGGVDSPMLRKLCSFGFKKLNLVGLITIHEAEVDDCLQQLAEASFVSSIESLQIDVVMGDGNYVSFSEVDDDDFQKIDLPDATVAKLNTAVLTQNLKNTLEDMFNFKYKPTNSTKQAVDDVLGQQ